MSVASPALIATFLRLDNRDANFVREKLFGKELAANAGNYRFGDRRFIDQYSNMLRAVGSGTYTGNLWVAITGTASPAAYPAGNIACVQANASGDTVTFTFGTATVVFTEGAAGANGFARGASNTTCAAALAAAINAHPIVGGLFTATPSTGNCGLVGKIPGAFLQDIALSTNDGTAFSFTQLTAGAEGAAQFFPMHIRTNRTP